ncbi:hypothetical protein ACIRPU_37095 [Streptomyces sp. NPDC102259]|uniref:hypothetical protein n=1 Tax=Streptomyces sp. NPDC102259 TaxID=3366148 RepID=UPI0037F937CE
MTITVFTVASLPGGPAPAEGPLTSARAQKLIRPGPTRPDSRVGGLPHPHG